MSPSSYRGAKISKGTSHAAARDLGRPQVKKTKVRNMLLEKITWEHFLNSAAHQACHRVLWLLIAKAAEMQL